MREGMHITTCAVYM